MKKTYFNIFLIALPLGASISTFTATYKITEKNLLDSQLNKLSQRTISIVAPLELPYFYTYYDGLNISLSQMIESNIESIMGLDMYSKLNFEYYYGYVENEDDEIFANKIDFDNYSTAQNILNFTLKLTSNQFDINKFIYFDYRPEFTFNEIVIDKDLKSKSIGTQLKSWLKNEDVLKDINNSFSKNGIKTTNGITKDPSDSDINFMLSDKAIKFIDDNKLISENSISKEVFNSIPMEWRSSFFKTNIDINFNYKNIFEISSKKIKELGWDWTSFEVNNNDSLESLDAVFTSYYENLFMEEFDLDKIPKLDLAYRVVKDGLPIYKSPIIEKEKYGEIVISQIPEDGHTLWIEFTHIDDLTIILDDGPGLHATFEIKE